MYRLLAYIILFLFLIKGVNGQVSLGYGLNNLFSDTVVNSQKIHDDIKPILRFSAMQSSDVELSVLKDNHLKIKPLFDISGRTNNEYRLGVGAMLEGSIRSKWYYRLSNLIGKGEASTNYIRKAYEVQLQASSDKKYIYQDLRGRVAFVPNQVFRFQMGLDNNFIGDGVRSLLLGDYGTPYPFAMINTNFWKVEYMNLYQVFREADLTGWKTKFAATHYLSFNALEWLSFGIFESVVFAPIDGGVNRKFEAEYLNPMIFYRPQEYAVGSPDNVLLGANGTLKFEQWKLYGQFILDDFLLAEIRAKSKWWANKYGVQAGMKGRFRLKGEQFFIRGEMNIVRPFTYGHLSDGQNYGNQSGVLAHPNGANLAESILEVKWRKNKVFAEIFMLYGLYGGITVENFGTDIYRSYNNRPFEYGHVIGQGNGYNKLLAIMRLGYQLDNPTQLNLFIEGRFVDRTDIGTKTTQGLIGIRSDLWNDYRNY